MPTSVILDELIERFDVFLIDQYGVLHDGITPYPDAINALERIKSAGHRVVLVSNSGKRASVNEARLSQLGFSSDLYNWFLPSGEVAWQQLKHELIGQRIPNNGRCLFLARDDDTSAIDGLGLTQVDDAAQADVILLSGCRDDLTLADYDRLLAAGVERNIPCLCTNPDKKMLVKGGIKFASGEVAQRYADRGGDVTWIGKPHPAIYSAALKRLDQPAPTRVVCIGDSIEHDIAGGHRAGFSTTLVKTGIVTGLNETELMAQYAHFGVTPDYLMDALATGHGKL